MQDAIKAATKTVVNSQNEVEDVMEWYPPQRAKTLND